MMKRLLRDPAMQVVLGWLVAGYMELMRRTVRWRHVDIDCTEFVLNDARLGAIALLWHGRIPVALTVGRVWLRKPRRCLVSPSADGEFFAQGLAHNNFPSIRASTAKKGDSIKARGLLAAFREAVAWIKSGGVLLITPDGPRGPNEAMSPGALQIAKRSGAPVFLMGIAVSPATHAGSWDRAMIGAPFGQGVVIWDGPLYVPADADDAAIQAMTAAWGERLSAVNRQAEALVAPKTH